MAGLLQFLPSDQPVGLLHIEQYRTHPQRRVCLHALQFLNASHVFLVYRLHNRRGAAKRNLYICRELTNNALGRTETKRALLFPTQLSVAFLLASETAKEGHFVRPRAGALV